MDGWMGQILQVDLSRKKITRSSTKLRMKEGKTTVTKKGEAKLKAFKRA